MSAGGVNDLRREIRRQAVRLDQSQSAIMIAGGRLDLLFDAVRPSVLAIGGDQQETEAVE